MCEDRSKNAINTASAIQSKKKERKREREKKALSFLRPWQTLFLAERERERERERDGKNGR
jgi:hypothetical protein